MITREMACALSMNIIMIIIVLPISAEAQPRQNVTPGSSIVATDANPSTWLSPSGEFAFGFQQVAPGGYLLAIWFDKITEKTIVWSANRDNLAEEGSRIQLLADGRFELRNSRRQQIWAADHTSSSVAYGAMLDNGDFVLVSGTNSSRFLWQSLDQPTDTLLPAQLVNQGVQLISSFSETNYTRGRFLLNFQQDGNLVLYTRNFPMDNTIFAYWTTGTNGTLGSQLFFNQSGFIYLLARNGTALTSLFSNQLSTSQLYQRLTLEYDGVLRLYVYPKSSNSTGGRPMRWSVSNFLPINICDSLVQVSVRGGVCGPNALCSLGTDERPECSCPFGYTKIDPNDRMTGCVQGFVPQSCDRATQDSHLFSFTEVSNSDWPFSDYASFSPVTEDWCRQACLDDCYCAVVAFTNDGQCVKKNNPLSNGRLSLSRTIKVLVKIRNNNTMIDMHRNSSSKSDRSTLIITGSVLLGSSAFLNLLLLASVLLFVFRFNRRKSDKIVPAFPGVNLRSLSFKELHEATNGFEDELGRGACSIVYRGSLDGGIVAVKKLDKIDADMEFVAEVSSISRTNHRNLVQLLGYCDEGQNRLLVYEFMSNGSLADYLFQSSSKPNWYRRLQIAFATARGLCYLHEECSFQIIHCDIKPQNVLIDESHTPKISDFGLAKLLQPDQTRTTTGIRGTRGYVAPEWFRNLPITAKVDVYSFGILLLEILCCRRNYETVKEEEEVILADWAYDCYKLGRLDLVVAEDEEAKKEIEVLEKMVMIAMWCIQEDPGMRPQMKRVMHMLEGSAEVPAPPDPASFIG